jgi:hypothetical protein
MPGYARRHNEAYDPKAVTHEVRTRLLTVRYCDDRTPEPGCPIRVIAVLRSGPHDRPDHASDGPPPDHQRVARSWQPMTGCDLPS